MRKALSIMIVAVGLTAFAPDGETYILQGYEWTGKVYEYYINPIGIHDGVDYSEYNDVIIESIASWERISAADVKVVYKGLTTDTSYVGYGAEYANQQNTVVWGTWSGTVIGQSSTLNGGGVAKESDIILNTNFATDGRLGLVITHEAGHTFGLGHTCEGFAGCDQSRQDAVMFFAVMQKKEFNCHEYSGLAALYPESSSCAPPDQYFVDLGCVDCNMCGDGYTDSTEVCDGDYMPCVKIEGYTGNGFGVCSSDCEQFDVSECIGADGEPVGDGDSDADADSDSDGDPDPPSSDDPDTGEAGGDADGDVDSDADGDGDVDDDQDAQEEQEPEVEWVKVEKCACSAVGQRERNMGLLELLAVLVSDEPTRRKS